MDSSGMQFVCGQNLSFGMMSINVEGRHNVCAKMRHPSQLDVCRDYLLPYLDILAVYLVYLMFMQSYFAILKL